MADPIMTICSLAGCSEDDARSAYEKTEDVVEAIDLVLARPVSACDRVVPLPKKKKREDITPDEEEVEKIRTTMKAFDSEMVEKMANVSNPPSHVLQDETQNHHEETALQNNYSQVCRLPLIEEEAQIPETVCPLPSEYSCDSQ